MSRYVNQDFEQMHRLYHFTSFDAAYKIIKSGALKFGKLFRMNDLLESNKISFEHSLYSRELMEKYNSAFAEEEMNRYQQISFSQDREYDDRTYLGFDLHSMWGLYANRGYGVCLVFDKNKLQIEEGDYARDVEYYDMVPTNYGFRNRSKPGIKAEIWRRRDDIFFLKRKEWEYEQEYRVIRRASRIIDDEYLNNIEALSFVILCRDYSVDEFDSIWSGDYYHEIKSLRKKVRVLYYEYGLDGYTLWPLDGDPIWAEQLGFL